MNTENDEQPADSYGFGIAIVGMACRFPGAEDIEAYWRNLRAGAEAITFFDKQELKEEGVDPALLERPDYVRARAVLSDIDKFDAKFFEYSPRDASLMDPQQRFFLETAWTALEDAGYGSNATRPRTGVFASASTNTYLMSNILQSREILDSVGRFQIQVVNQLDALATHTSYKLNLTGPSLTVQTACSSSLVSLHLAAQSLLNGECDVALSGAVSIRVPHKEGYLYQKDGIASPDGHCRPFDAEAAGTLGGNGVGVVVLKRLADALADGDNIRAVLRGTAINNDGAHKVGFTAPSVDGQAEVIAEAMANADCDFRSISYVEAHGTGTLLGDPIEIAALTKAHRTETPDTQYCHIGSVKSNIGHLDAAAGIAGLIKLALSLERKEIPPSLHLKKPNPKIDFASSPFRVCSELRPWEADEYPRRAGLSSFGFGGTNAHAVLEEAPEREPSGPSRGLHVIPVSAKSESALERASERLASRLKENPDTSLADLSYTLSLGRHPFAQRKAIVASDAAGALAGLLDEPQGVAFSGVAPQRARRVVFVFPGQGAQYPGMARGLYALEPVFREELDRCFSIASALMSADLHGTLFDDDRDRSYRKLRDTEFCQPILFSVEYALARLWNSWGVEPSGMIGHSLGDYVAACLAGVFSLEDALKVVVARGRLMKSPGEGRMLGVALSIEELRPLIPEALDLAAVSSPHSCTVVGPTGEIEAFAAKLKAQGVNCKTLDIDTPCHSRLMDAILPEFERIIASVELAAPEIPMVSSCTGDWLAPEQAADPAYWASQIRRPVLFGEGASRFYEWTDAVFLEVGPRLLGSHMVSHFPGEEKPVCVVALKRERDEVSDGEVAARALAQLWTEGAEIDWEGYYAGEDRRRISLPGYAFDDQRYWIAPDRVARASTAPIAAVAEQGAVAAAAPEAAFRKVKRHPRPALSTPFVDPAGDEELAVAEIWQGLLGVDKIGANDNFFELGGDSLAGVQMVSRLRERFQVNVSLNELYDTPTVSAVAASVRAMTAPGADEDIAALLDQVEGLSDDEVLDALADKP